MVGCPLFPFQEEAQMYELKSKPLTKIQVVRDLGNKLYWRLQDLWSDLLRKLDPNRTRDDYDLCRPVAYRDIGGNILVPSFRRELSYHESVAISLEIVQALHQSEPENGHAYDLVTCRLKADYWDLMWEETDPRFKDPRFR